MKRLLLTQLTLTLLLLFQACTAIDVSSDDSNENSNNTTTTTTTTNNGNETGKSESKIECDNLTGSDDYVTVSAKIRTDEYAMDFIIDIDGVVITPVVNTDGQFYIINQTILLDDNNGTALDIHVKLLDGESVIITEGICKQPSL